MFWFWYLYLWVCYKLMINAGSVWSVPGLRAVTSSQHFHSSRTRKIQTSYNSQIHQGTASYQVQTEYKTWSGVSVVSSWAEPQSRRLIWPDSWSREYSSLGKLKIMRLSLPFKSIAIWLVLSCILGSNSWPWSSLLESHEQWYWNIRIDKMRLGWSWLLLTCLLCSLLVAEIVSMNRSRLKWLTFE